MEVINETTTITYEEAKKAAEDMKQCANQMKGIFADFENTMNQTGTEDIFFGKASDAVTSKFTELKKRFNSFTQLVEMFSNTISSATSAEEATENAIAQDAQNLFG